MFPLSKILLLILIIYRTKSKFHNGPVWPSQPDLSFLSSLIYCHYLPPCFTIVDIYENVCMRLLCTWFTLSEIFFSVSCIKFKSLLLKNLRIPETLWNLPESPSPALFLAYQPTLIIAYRLFSYYCFHHMHLAKYLLHVCLSTWPGK